MAHIVEDRVAELSTTTGTGAFTLAGAITSYRAFSAVCATSDTVNYLIEAVDGAGIPTGEWETGVGTYSGANTLTRTTVHRSSNANSAVSFSAGVKRVVCVAPNVSTDGTLAGNSDSLIATQKAVKAYVDANGGGRSLSPLQMCALIPLTNSATPSGIGLNSQNAGLTARTLATTSYTTQIRRIGIETTSVANTARYWYSSHNIIWRGNASNRGGFYFEGTLSVDVKVTTATAFLGIAPAATWGSADTISSKLNLIGVGAEDGDTNWSLYTNDGSGSATKTTLGASFPFANGCDLELILECDPNGSSVSYSVTDKITGNTTSGTISSDLPDSATFLTPMVWLSNRATASNFQCSTHGLLAYDKRGIT